jgi:peptide-methionine (R)-S-oxide reductase
MEQINKTELRNRLTPLQWRVTQEAGTERPFTGEYWNVKDDGTYRCVVCDTALFTSETKYDSRSGWPSFWDVLDEAAVKLIEDRSLGMVRTEVECAACGARQGCAIASIRPRSRSSARTRRHSRSGGSVR